MALTKYKICDFGWKARDFALKGVEGKTHLLADVRGPKGLLVVFICNHCPYVKASIGRIVAEAKALREIGIGTIAIMPNDTRPTSGNRRRAALAVIMALHWSGLPRSHCPKSSALAIAILSVKGLTCLARRRWRNHVARTCRAQLAPASGQ